MSESNVVEVPITVEQLDYILLLQQEVMERVAREDNYRSVIQHLCKMAESLLEGAVASVMLLDPEAGVLNVLAAPSVPESGVLALQGLKPGKGGGSCGNAVFTNNPVYVVDTFTDPRWEGLRQLAIDFNICACWSMPIRNAQGQAIGSFALSSFEHRAPSLFHQRLLEVAASIISIVITRHQQQVQLKEKNFRLQLLGTALSSSSDAVMVTDVQNRILEVNRSFEEVSGYSQAEVIGLSPDILDSGRQSKAFYQDMWRNLQEKGCWQGEIINRTKGGTEWMQLLRISCIHNDEGQLTHYVSVGSDLTALRSGERKLVQVLETDSLTGLANQAKLAIELSQLQEPVTLLLINVDNFSYINSAYGWSFGDKLLIKIARKLQALEPQAKIYRINADEFALKFSSQDGDLAKTIAQLRQYFFSNQVDVEHLAFNINFSCGGSVGMEGVFGQALIALKRAKATGKNHSHIYCAEKDEQEQEKRLEHIYWNGVLHYALQRNKLKAVFQGIRNNKTGQMTHYEALARIEHEGVLHSPYQFLEAARLSGLLPAITRSMIDQSFAQISGSEYSLSINITEDDLSQGYLESYLTQKIAQYSILADRVTLEILEGVSAAGKKNHIAQLRSLKKLGFKLAIDDFGTEYSNFERIIELNVDYVKIDGKYIKDIDTNHTSYEVTRAIAFFAHNAGIQTVAEFVHSGKVQSIVESLGIDFSQGYEFSLPGAIPEANSVKG